MFRNDLGDVSLFGGHKAAAPKPAFRPAVEALEERAMLSGMSSCASTPQADTSDPGEVAAVSQITVLLDSLTTTLNASVNKYNRAQSRASFDHVKNQVRQFEGLLAGVGGGLGGIAGALQQEIANLGPCDAALSQACVAAANACDHLTIAVLAGQQLTHTQHDWPLGVVGQIFGLLGAANNAATTAAANTQ
jgi:hypothetical protein